ncbi:MAG TPA: head GIN domain-containing protein [Puia sp.]|nr:head GIN domain-containing protein [Puia sp.]
MRKLYFILVGVLLVLSSRAQKTIVHDPNAQVRAVKGYHGIEVGSAIDLYLSQGDEETVVVSAKDERWRDRIITEVVDGILKIRLQSGHFSTGNNKLKAYVSFVALDKLSASGASNVYVDGVISGNKLSLTLSGASDFKGAIRVGELQLDQNGASDAKITGVVAGLAVIRLSGASDVKGYDLTVESCEASASGASDIRITVNKELKANATGASSVYYKGEGVISESRASGASTIKKS